MEWNQTEADYPRDKCVHQIFEAQAQNTPDAVAVVFEQSKLTYAKLNAQSNQLARYLQRHGLRPGSFVASFMERSSDLIVTLLATLKSGGAYLALETNIPSKRLRSILGDARPAVVVVKSQQEKATVESAGLADGAAVDSLIWEFFNAINPLLVSQTRVLVKSPPYGIPPVVVPKELDADLKKQLKQVFLSLHTDKEAAALLAKIQIERFNGHDGIHCNAQLTPSLMRDHCNISPEGNQLLKNAMEKLGLSARAYDRILKVSRTIADMEECSNIEPHHLAEAINYRSLDRENWAG